MALSLGTADTESLILLSFLPLVTSSDEYTKGQLSACAARGFVSSHGHRAKWQPPCEACWPLCLTVFGYEDLGQVTIARPCEMPAVPNELPPDG